MLIGTMLVRNEQDRYLERVLADMLQVCDKIIVLDDNSSDDTVKICKAAGAEVHCLGQSLWGVNEAIPRKILFDLACQHNPDWILCLDADETIPGISRLLHVLGVVDKLSERVDGIGFNLYDMWDEEHYRSDDLWNAHTRDWPMCMRYDKDKVYEWREGLHCGRFPLNAFGNGNIIRSGLKLQHWGWAKQEDRQKKYERYMHIDPDGKWGCKEQYISILDENPNLEVFK